MRTISRTPIRWFVPLLAAVLLLGGGWGYAKLAASAEPGLPHRTPAQLLVDVAHAHVDGLSGTLVQTANLGIPSLPGRSDSSSFSSLLTGSHTMQIWLSSPGKARIALQGSFGESDLVKNGRDLWVWSSRGRTVTHRVLPSGSRDHTRSGKRTEQGTPQVGATPLTPQQAAQQALKAMDPTTRVTTDGTAVVAGRRAYELVLEPKQPGSLISQVRIAVDGTTHIPLQVQVIPTGSANPAFEVGFTSFQPTRPADSVFRFTPPPGAKVTQGGTPGPASGDHRGTTPGSTKPGAGTATPQSKGWSGQKVPGNRPTVVGKGWTAVTIVKLPPGGLAALTGSPSASTDGHAASATAQLAQVLKSLPAVSGPWGSGRLFQGTLFSAVLTNDGRLAIGAVHAQTLYDALASR